MIRIILLLLLSPLCAVRASPAAPLPPEALDSALQRCRMHDDLSGWIYAQLQWVAGSPANRSGRLADAVGKAWRRPRTEAEIQAWQDLLANEGYALLISGDIVHSTDAYTAAYEWAATHPELEDDDAVLETILKPLGNNYTRLGDYEQALFIHEKALRLALKGSDKEALAGAYSNLANTSSNMGRPLQSLEYCRKGLIVVDEHSALRGLLFSEQADACQQLQRQKMAETSIHKSIDLLERHYTRDRKAGTGYWLLMAYQQAGDIYGSTPARGLYWYDKALILQKELLERQGEMRQRERAKLFQRLSSLYARLHEEIQAVHWSDECLNVLVPGRPAADLKKTDLYAENTLADLLYTRAVISDDLGETDEALRFYALYFATEKKLRQALITGSAKEGAVANIRERYEEAIGLAWDCWKRTSDRRYRDTMLLFMESSKSQLLLDELLKQRQTGNGPNADSLGNRIRLLENALVYYERESLQYHAGDSMATLYSGREKQIAWELAQLHRKAGRQHNGVEPVETAFAPSSLPGIFDKGQAGRLFFTGARATYTVECTGGGISFVEKLPLGRSWEDSVARFTETWFRQGVNTMIDHPLAYCRQAYSIYKALFGDHPLQTSTEYILFPDGPLTLLPVEALLTATAPPASPAEWPFVIKKALISYGWSLQTLLQQKTNMGAGELFSGFFLSNKGLGAVGDEEEGIKKNVNGGHWYVDTQATAAKFREALENSAIVHISSHAFLKKDSLSIPHIELFDKPFYLFELQSMSRHPAMVVLGACRTADGKMITGEGLQSLARGFTAGGVNAVVAGWWNVNDETAARLMTAFYGNLAMAHNTSQERANAAMALRQAKLDWLDDPALPYLRKLPYYWAALGYLGDPTPPLNDSLIDDSRGQKRIKWWWLVLLPPIFLVWRFYQFRRKVNGRFRAWVFVRGQKGRSQG